MRSTYQIVSLFANYIRVLRLIIDDSQRKSLQRGLDQIVLQSNLNSLQIHSDAASLSKTKMWVFQPQSLIGSDLAECPQETTSEWLACVADSIPSPNSIKPTAIKASDLPKHHWKDPTCYAAISIDGGSLKNTGCEKGINPEWNSSYDLYVSVC
jgi:hypothetical protein